MRNQNDITVMQEDPRSLDAICLMEELSDCLASITGDSGKASFDVSDVCSARAMFVIARDRDGKAVGCGAFRRMDETAAEVKRMYAKTPSAGTGAAMLSFLEKQAYKIGYSVLRLETRLVNQRAVAFYERNGYHRIPNYGKYAGNQKAVCFEKSLRQ